MTRILIAKQPA